MCAVRRGVPEIGDQCIATVARIRRLILAKRKKHRTEQDQIMSTAAGT